MISASAMLHTISFHFVLFQLGGIHRNHHLPVKNQIFQKLPGRLGFNLSCLVDESVLQEGWVLGCSV